MSTKSFRFQARKFVFKKCFVLKNVLSASRNKYFKVVIVPVFSVCE